MRLLQIHGCNLTLMLGIYILVICNVIPLSMVDAQEVTPYLSIDQVLYQPQRITVADDGTILVSEPRRNRVRTLSEFGVMLSNYNVERSLAVGLDAEGLVLIGSCTRVDAFQDIGEIAYSLGAGEGEFNKPNDLAVSSAGRIFVTDSPANCVKVYEPGGGFLFSFGTEGSSPGQFSFPTGICLNTASTEVFVADQGNSRIQVFDLNGNYIRSFGQFPYLVGEEWQFEGTFTRIQGLAVDVNDRIYVIDSYQNNIQVLTAEGEFLGFIAQDLSGEQYFSLPMDVFARDNLLYVTSSADSRVQIFTLDDVTGISEESVSEIPERFELLQNYPNPFNPETHITFSLPNPGWVQLTIWNIMGRQIAALADNSFSAGTHTVVWNGSTFSGTIAASGVYFYNVKVSDNSGKLLYNANQKMLLLK